MVMHKSGLGSCGPYSNSVKGRVVPTALRVCGRPPHASSAAPLASLQTAAASASTINSQCCCYQTACSHWLPSYFTAGVLLPQYFFLHSSEKPLDLSICRGSGHLAKFELGDCWSLFLWKNNKAGSLFQSSFSAPFRWSMIRISLYLLKKSIQKENFFFIIVIFSFWSHRCWLLMLAAMIITFFYFHYVLMQIYFYETSMSKVLFFQNGFFILMQIKASPVLMVWSDCL